MAFPLVPQMLNQQSRIVPGGATLGLGDRFNKWSGNHQNALLALGAGLIGNRENATLNPISQAVGGMALGQRADQQNQQDSERKNATVQWLVTNKGIPEEQAQSIVQGDPAILASMLKGSDYPNSYQEFQLAQSNPAYGDYLKSQEAGNAHMGLQPFYTTDANGVLHAYQFSTAGGMEEVEMPDGQTPAPPLQQMDLGTTRGMVNPRTGDIGASYPVDVSGEAAQRQVGESRGAGQAGLPKAEQVAQSMLGMIEDVKNDPYLGRAVGASSVLDPRNYIPGTGGVDFYQKLEQLKGQAFLQAFETLRGGGAITEREGQAATAAIARLNTAQSDEAFKQALSDLEQVVRQGYIRAQQRAGIPEEEAAPLPGTQPLGGTTGGGIGWTVEP